MKKILTYSFILFFLLGAYGTIQMGNFSPLMYQPGSISFYTEAMLRDAVQVATMRAWTIAGVLGCLIFFASIAKIVKK